MSGLHRPATVCKTASMTTLLATACRSFAMARLYSSPLPWCGHERSLLRIAWLVCVSGSPPPLCCVVLWCCVVFVFVLGGARTICLGMGWDGMGLVSDTDESDGMATHASILRCAATSSGREGGPPRRIRHYELLKEVGLGGSATTYAARDVEGNDVAVALKMLSMRRMKGWKALDRFQREAKVLQSLSHPGIPQYVDAFQEESAEDVTFCIVQELAEGKNLQQLVEEGWRPEEKEIERIAQEILEVLAYLGELRPPVVHRDVKPANLILEGGVKGGKLYLVDFGSVQDVVRFAEEGFGSTTVGTFGYMAPEQFRGVATPASDLYALGGTLLFLLSGRPPSAFPQERLRIDFSNVVVGPRLSLLLEGLLEPVPEDRIQNAEEAMRILRQESAITRSQPAWSEKRGSMESQWPTRVRQSGPRRPPAGTKCALKRTPGRLLIEMPPAGLKGENVGTGLFAVAWNSFTFFWTFSALTAGAPFVFAAFSLPFWFAGYTLAKESVGGALIRTTLEMTPKRWSLTAEALGKSWTKVVEGRTDDITRVDVKVRIITNGVPQTCVELVEGVNRYTFGESLATVEHEWVAGEIRAFLEETDALWAG